MKKNKFIALIMALAVLLNLTPVSAAETTSVNSIIEKYMGARYVSLLLGETKGLEDYSVAGVVEDEKNHYDALTEKSCQVLATKHEIVLTEESDTGMEVVLEETVYYLSEWKIQSEDVEHIITLMYTGDDELIVVADAYYEEYSEFISASYVNPYAVSLTDEGGSDDCIVYIAGTQVNYYEKATNESLDSFTANAGNGNYTKYGKWFGSNGVPWCAIFVSWCANQANVSTSIVKKTASCDDSMNFFKNLGQFYYSSACGGSYTPQVGDIFYTGTYTKNSSTGAIENVDATHTGIVAGVSGSVITVIHGNSTLNGQDQVRKSTYSLSNTSLLGFAKPAYENTAHTHEWNSNSSTHWGVCSVCGYTSTSTSHTYSWNSTSSSHWKTCNICAYTTSSTSHTLVWKSNLTKHWKECSSCGYSTTTSSHTSSWTWSTSSHWKECSSCGYASVAVAHTWVGMGSYDKCSGCGVKSTELPSTLSLSLDENEIVYSTVNVLQ